MTALFNLNLSADFRTVNPVEDNIEFAIYMVNFAGHYNGLVNERYAEGDAAEGTFVLRQLFDVRTLSMEIYVETTFFPGQVPLPHIWMLIGGRSIKIGIDDMQAIVRVPSCTETVMYAMTMLMKLYNDVAFLAERRMSEIDYH
jgi:hypothetical protein